MYQEKEEKTPRIHDSVDASIKWYYVNTGETKDV